MNGILNIVKPAGFTSSDIVVRVRRMAGEKRVGHMGTLDPGACGVLPVGVGKSARLFDYMLTKTKEYVARFVFGKTTDTLDSFGKVTQTSEKRVTAEQLRAVLPLFTGDIAQVPPLYSAIKLGGRKACDLARRGVESTLPLRHVTISEFGLLDQTDENEFLFHVACSAGTYIRALCRDLAEAVGTVGYMSALVRTRAGAFRVEEGVSLQDLERDGVAAHLLSPGVVLQDLPKLVLPDESYFPFTNGVPVPTEMEGDCTVYCREEFFGIGECAQGLVTLRTYLKD